MSREEFYMHTFKVGEIVEKFAHHQEGTLFDIADDGASMIVFFNKPTEAEIAQFASENPFEIRSVKLNEVIVITVKIGNLNWMDAPYNVNLSKNLTQLNFPDRNQGLALTLILVDAVTGKIKHMRLIGLTERFTKNLFEDVWEQFDDNFNKEVYGSKIKDLFCRYSTKEIVKISTNYCKISKG